jgi:hypothetical protein
MKIHLSLLRIRNRKNVAPAKLYLSSEYETWPGWIHRDLGLNDPEHAMSRLEETAQQKKSRRKGGFLKWPRWI